MDMTTVIGITIGVVGILLGNVLEGGHFSSLIQFTAALIVFAGTIGATVASHTQSNLKLAIELCKGAFRKDGLDNRKKIVDQILHAASTARKESILALESQVNRYSDPFMKRVFRYVVDGVEERIIRDVFEADIEVQESRKMAGAKVWADAGGFAPTIGIIGAVLGLIHVMSNLSDTSALGQGIAVAFVATIYGVASANLIFLPISNKIKSKVHQESDIQWMILEGAIAISKGYNPFVVEEKLRSYLDSDPTAA